MKLRTTRKVQFLFSRRLGCWVNLRFYLFASGVKQVEWEREVSPRFPFVTRGVWASTLTYREGGGVITCVWSVCRWLSQWWLVFFIGVRCYSERWVWDLLPHGRLSPFVVEQSVVVMSSKLNPTGSQFSIPVLWNLCSESMEYKILRLSWGLQHWRSEFSHRSILILWTLCGKPMRERQKTLLS